MPLPRMREFCGIALVALALLGWSAHAAEGEPASAPVTDDKTLESADFKPALKSSDSLTVSGSQPDPQRLAEIRAQQARFAATLNEAEAPKPPPAPAVPAQAESASASAPAASSPTTSASSPPTSSSTEVGALKAEADRIKQQSQSDKAALNAVGIESSTLNGFIIFGAILAVCLVVVGWALWHNHVVRKGELEDSWERAHDDDLGMTDFMLLEGNSEFASTQFGNTEFTSTGSYPTGLHSTEFHTTGTYHTEGGHAEIDTTLPDAKAAPAAELALAKAVDEVAKPAKPASRPYTYRRIEGNDGSWAFKFGAKSADASAVPPVAKPIDPAQLRKANEIFDVMQLAESWMSVHDPVELLETLEPFKNVELPESPIPWLCLLDVYRVLGDQEKYEAILKRIKKIFNVKMPSLFQQAEEGDVPTRRLADYPNIVETIFDLWEGDEIVPYLKGLLVDNRDGKRDGFDLPVYRSILQLIALASDPDRAKRHDQITHGKAYAILYSEQPRQPSGELKDGATVRPEVPVKDDKQADALPAAKIVPPVEDSTPKNKAPDRPATAELQLVSESRQAATQLEVSDQPEPPKSQEAPKQSVDYDDMSSMSIKLHLAIAYQDIGDEEGARLLLDEVIKDGSFDQSEKAKLMLAKLA